MIFEIVVIVILLVILFIVGLMNRRTCNIRRDAEEAKELASACLKILQEQRDNPEGFIKTEFANLFNMVETLGDKVLPDDTPLFDVMPTKWPTFGDLRQLVFKAKLVRKD